jgi:hypothetical protein
MSTWLHGRRYVVFLTALAVIAVIAVLLLRDRPFTPQASYETVVATTPDSHRFDLTAGQNLGVRFILSHSKDRGVSVAMASLSEGAGGAWHKDRTVEGYGNVADCEVIWFEAPATGHYALEVSSPGAERLNVTVEYCILGQ